MKLINTGKKGILTISILFLFVLCENIYARQIDPNRPDNPRDTGGLVLPDQPDYYPDAPEEIIPKSPYTTILWRTPSSIKIKWHDRSNVETGFRIEKKEEGGLWEVISNVDSPTPELHTIGEHVFSSLQSNASYCFKVIAYNNEGESLLGKRCARTVAERPEGYCSEEKLNEIVESPRTYVYVNCNFSLVFKQAISRKLIFEGSDASGVTVDLNEGTLTGNHEVRSKEIIFTKEKNEKDIYTEEISTYDRPQNITIKNGRINGSIRVWGMARNGEGDSEYIDCLDFATEVLKCEISNSNQLRKSSRTADHTQRVRNNAPTNIVFDNLTLRGMGSTNPLYFGPGVTDSKFINSRLEGSGTVGIYLDTETSRILIKNNTFDIFTKKPHLLKRFYLPTHPVIAIDGSSNNTIVNNYFTQLSRGGIYLYRNCGANGVIRHSTPSYNKIINNIFYYNKYRLSSDPDTYLPIAGEPSVYLGSRDKGGLIDNNLKYCGEDNGYPFGSSASDRDFAKHNVIMQNQIYKFSPDIMIKTNNPSINSPNYIDFNETVNDQTVDLNRPAGCFSESRGFMQHDEFFTINNSECDHYKYTCENGDIVKKQILPQYSQCMNSNNSYYSK